MQAAVISIHPRQGSILKHGGTVNQNGYLTERSGGFKYGMGCPFGISQIGCHGDRFSAFGPNAIHENTGFHG
jgi:hypothetical protein